MSLSDCGPALVLIYGGGRRETTLMHNQDGGEAYMRPLLRKAVQYARTHYNSGDILAVLMSEGNMHEVGEGGVVDVARGARVRHVYYVEYRWSPDTGTKTYRVRALHLAEKHYATAEHLPDDARNIPESAVQLA